MYQAHVLARLLEPRSIAVVGASPRPEAIGHVILRNIVAGGFPGKVWAVNPRHDEVLGQPCVASVEAIDGGVDLAIAAVAPALLPEIVDQCGRAGIRHLIVVSNPLASGGARSAQRLRDAARKAGVRLLGPKSLGLMRPHRKLNATYTEIAPLAGEVALIAQSGAMCAAVVDWATGNGVGLSAAVALGAGLDIDFGEILDFLVHDDRTRYILLHVERVRDARGFMSALRSAARVKPVILLKSGGSELFAEIDRGLDEAQRRERDIVRDAVFDVAIRRTGVVRVQRISQLFYAAKALASGFQPRGSRLAIVGNGTGPGAMAADCAAALDIPLARPGAATVAALQALLPAEAAARMPIDVGGDATPERTLEVLKVLADDPEVDATLVLISPLAPARPSVLAQGIVDFAKQRRLTLCCCLMGGASVAEARRILEDAGIPVFRTPDTVIELFHNIATYYRNQQLLLQVPASGDKGEGDGGDGAAPSGNGRLLVEAVLAERRLELSAVEARSLLKGAGIPVPQTLLARSATEAMFAAEQLGLPVTLRLDRTLTCARPGPADVPRTHLATAEAVRAAFHEIVSTAGPAPSGGLAVAVEPWRPRPHARVLAISVYRDPVFGPVIQFGAGRHQAEVFGDREVALPPLNGVLARDLIERTRFSRTLDAYLDLPAVDRKAVERALLAVSGLVCELPWIRTLEIDPLLADERGVIATDVRVSLDYAMVADHRYGHMAIHPYPAHLCQEWPLADGRNVTVRPVRPEDAPLEQAFIDAMSDEARQFRFMDSRPLPASLAVRLTQVDYDRELAFIAVVEENGVERQIGSARYGQALDAEAVEFALAVDERWQKFGLGRRLMGLLADCARAKGYRRIVGDVLGDNTKMLRLMHSLGYAVQPHPDGGGLKRVSKVLNA